MTTRKEIIETLSNVNVQQYVEQKMGLSYLSWANAWAILTQYYPNATYEFEEYPEYLLTKDGNWYATGRNVDYRLTPSGCEVTASVNIEGETFKMSLYVMDNRNKPVRNPDYAQINKTQQRCLVKALALAGLGLNLYQGEDLPASENMKRKGINPEQQAMQQKVAKLKARMSQLLGEVAIATKTKTKEVQDIVIETIRNEYQGAGEMTPVEKFETMINVLENMKKEATGKNSEEMTFEEVEQ